MLVHTQSLSDSTFFLPDLVTFQFPPTSQIYSIIQKPTSESNGEHVLPLRHMMQTTTLFHSAAHVASQHSITHLEEISFCFLLHTNPYTHTHECLVPLWLTGKRDRVCHPSSPESRTILVLWLLATDGCGSVWIESHDLLEIWQTLFDHTTWNPLIGNVYSVPVWPKWMPDLINEEIIKLCKNK